MVKLTTLLAPIVVAASAKTATITLKNTCSYGITIHSASSTSGDPLNGQGVYLGPGQQTDRYTYGWSGNLFANSPGSLAEFTIGAHDDNDYYDVSFIVGFNMGIDIWSSNGGHNIYCPNDSCTDAYHTPNDNWATHGTRTGGNFIVTWCP